MPIDGRLPVELLRLCRGGGKADDEFVGVAMAEYMQARELLHTQAPFVLCLSRKRQYELRNCGRSSSTKATAFDTAPHVVPLRENYRHVYVIIFLRNKSKSPLVSLYRPVHMCRSRSTGRIKGPNPTFETKEICLMRKQSSS